MTHKRQRQQRHGEQQAGGHHQPIGIEPRTQFWQQHGTANRAQPNAGEHQAIAAGTKAKFTARHQRQQRPARAGEQKKGDGADQHVTQHRCRMNVTQSCPYRREKMLRRQPLYARRWFPAPQHPHNAEHRQGIQRKHHPRTGKRENQPAQRRANRPADVDAQRIQRDGRA